MPICQRRTPKGAFAPFRLRRALAGWLQYATHSAEISALFVYEQIHSEYWSATESDDTRGALEYRLDDVWEDFGSELSAVQNHYIVVDLQRRDRTWLVDWRGGIRDEPDNRGGFSFGVRRDEHDNDERPILDLGSGRVLVDASVAITDLSRHLGTELPESDDYNSVGGFIVARLGRVPGVGAKVRGFGFEFIVRAADERHVAKVEIVRSDSTRPPPPAKPASMAPG